ncbi:hypothetical protein IU459_09755 [Nocardia amamiensis]|uniref:DUF6879 domain-containing protein n=1 Tax=Nocardia amamiensis TaxID=404578 RepID=A0ABS0CMK7_9NOCA|nr:DUF6879 family protein [Nocardia amamiensis]MBF6297829.1 hypothetical protein [Nocardia amamiensis]
MQLLQGEAFDEFFHKFERTAYHLEVLDTYSTPEEDEPFRQFLAGEPDDYEWFKDWEELVREITASGRVMHRARVVTEPHTDYTRWSLVVAHQNIAAGEDIRYLARHLIDPSELTTDDFWLFDDNLVAFTVFEPSGQFVGGAFTEDPVIVGHCRAVWNRVWNKSLPHAEYIKA